MSKKRKGIRVLQFFISMFLTVFILGSGLLLVLTDTIPADTEVGFLPKENRNVRLLFCETDNNISYEVSVDFDLKHLSVKRLEFDNSIYQKKGFSGAVNTAGAQFGKFTGAIFATETQAAALIDYSGGYPCSVGEHISSLCGDIGTGYQVLAGITVIKIFKSEENNRALCLDIIENAAYNWCKIIGEPRNFFKLLDLSTNDLSYTDYLPIKSEFKNIGNATS